MKVAVIGGTGFVGSHLVDRLIRDGHTPRLLVRPESGSKVEHPQDCEIVVGDVGSSSELEGCLEGTQAVIYLIGLLREFPSRGITFDAMHREGAERTMEAARRKGVRHFVYMSANGVRPDGTPYQSTKYAAEEALKASGLVWTIFRPSVVFGEPRGRMEFCTQLKRDIVDSPLPAPLFYSGLLPKNAGAFELAPVAVEDVAAAFSLALAEPRAESQTYSLCGPDRLTWREILQTIARAAGKSKLMLPAPAMAVGSVARVFDRFAWFPITADQLKMLLEGNVCYENDSFARLGLTPKRFTADALAYLND